MANRSCSFTHAIARRPATTVVAGLRAADTGVPDHCSFKQHHADYVDALRSTGAVVEVLPPLEAFPDSVFVEDTALCLPEGAVVMRPGAPSRLGEAQAIAPHLTKHYEDIRSIEAPGFIEGGDILVTEREILVGRSARTSRDGIDALRSIVDAWGYTVREVSTPRGVLHFKTDCAILDEETILATPRLSASGCFKGYRIIHTAEGEDASANIVRFNDLVLVPDGFPKTAEHLVSRGYNLRPVRNTEAAKLDGGMSCLSLRFSPRR
ncbi:MAG: arginine deiminase family protein [Alphaproteobacteria bacterium]|nr:arginine deiminase family protein [Alphaproteobacteria bacterium]